MFNMLIQKAKKLIITFRLSILSIFSILFLSSILLLIAINYYALSTTMSVTSFKLMDKTSSLVNQQISGEIETALSLTEYSASLIQSHLLDLNNLNEMLENVDKLVMKGAANLISIQSAVWADKNGNFVVSHKPNEKGDQILEIINRNQTPVSRTIITRDSHGNTTQKTLTQNITIDQRTRPWYISTAKAKKPFVTDFFQYTYANYQVQGINVDVPVLDKEGEVLGVLALYMRIDYLRELIENIKVGPHGFIFIVTNAGQVLAFPKLEQYNNVSLLNIHQLTIPWIIKSFDEYEKTGQKEFRFEYNKNVYLANYNDLGQFGDHQWLIGVVVPQSDFTDELKHINLITVLASFIILIIGIIFISGLTARIVKPLQQLTEETDRIKNFELEGSITIVSRIKEIIMLTYALNAMKKGLRSFQKYVPATLVRHIIEAGTDAQVGGAKKQLAILFSDIKDFTSITEQVDPATLMTQLCEYFDTLTHFILEEKGTVDKYIGDSIMAFWGAPLIVEQPCHHAAKAALKCIHSLSALNKQWIAQGLSPMITRIGLHIGDSIVGNVGSTERMNYTAIGDSINIASRLEGVNKLYGTAIIVSNAIYQEIKDSFALRFVDQVILKGTFEIITIYELLSEDQSQLSFDLAKYNAVYTKGFEAYQSQKWDVAIEYFSECLKIYPEDTIALVFINRCKHYKLNPPTASWDGVWHLQEK